MNAIDEDLGAIADMLYQDLIGKYGIGERVGIPQVKDMAQYIITTLEAQCNASRVLHLLEQSNRIKRISCLLYTSPSPRD